MAIPLPSGKVKRLRFDKKSDAEKALRKGLQARNEGRLTVGPRQTVGQFLARWLEDSAKHTLRDSTYVRYENLIGCSIVPHVGQVPLSAPHASGPEHGAHGEDERCGLAEGVARTTEPLGATRPSLVESWNGRAHPRRIYRLR